MIRKCLLRRKDLEMKAKVVQHSSYVNGDGDASEIITFELEYPRFIHSEVMTHRVFSRNAASSRAIPIDKMIDQVLKAPAMPVNWGINQAGMQAGSEHRNTMACIKAWCMAARSAVESARLLQGMGLHKQIVNRVLEPFQMMKTIITSTEWDNFYELRLHADTQPEFRHLAMLMKDAHSSSTPFMLNSGEWHVPYVDRYRCPEYEDLAYMLFDEDCTDLTLAQALKVSSSCCAQVSYRVLDDTLEKAEKIYDRLVNSKPIHASPFEHQASPERANHFNGNLVGWVQYRKLLEIL
jgi:hypothetical protein